MKIKLTQDYGHWKKGDIITHNGSLAERLVEQGKAVAVKVPSSTGHENLEPSPAVEDVPGDPVVDAKPETAAKKRQKAAEQHEP